jgi:hypothetical protein
VFPYPQSIRFEQRFARRPTTDGTAAPPLLAEAQP